MILRSAERRTGLSNWGAADFHDRLALWQWCLARDSGLNDLGRHAAETTLLGHACNRLRLEALIERHPEIESTALPPPIIVAGLPRSGTTVLARLIARHFDVRWMPYWEAVEPFSGDEARRRVAARRRREELLAVAPDLPALHDCREDAFVDDTELQCLAFGSYALEWHAHVPAWRDAYLSEDQTPVYRYLRRAMQALTFLRGPRRWLLKSPQHVEQLGAIATVFPGATLVVTTRAGDGAVQSMRRIMDAMMPLRRWPYPRAYWTDRLTIMQGRYEGAAHLFPERVEARMEDWLAEPGAMIDRVARLGGAARRDNVEPDRVRPATGDGVRVRA